MSIKQWPGGVISDNPVVPAGNYQNSAAPGVWTLDRVAYWRAQDLWPTFGNINPDSYIENLFSTYLYTGNNSTQTIINGIDLAGEGGLVWAKARNIAGNHYLVDTVRGRAYGIQSSTTAAQYTSTPTEDLTAFNSNGFSLGVGYNSSINNSGQPIVSWTFRKAPKFFDIVTFTGNGAPNRVISHNLGSTPGCLIVKTTSAIDNWYVWHRSLPNSATGYLKLNTTDAQLDSGTSWFTATSTTFTIVNNSANTNGVTYVAYLFAHDAGGFGASGAENVISCGSYTANNGNNVEVTLGWEPQFIIVKNASASTGGWYMSDNMRGLAVQGSSSAHLFPNSSSAEGTATNGITATATGFIAGNLSNINAANTTSNFIYIAIRRGPMAVPTLGTSVFAPVARNGTGVQANIQSGFVVDLIINKSRNNIGPGTPYVFDRLRGKDKYMATDTATYGGTEGSDSTSVIGFDVMNGVTVGDGSAAGRVNYAYGSTFIDWYFRRAPGFMDMVTYTGNDTLRTIEHNLGVVPEMMIVKIRDASLNWAVYHSGIGNTKYILLDSTAAEATSSTYWNDTSPTASVFTVNTSNKVNSLPSPYIAYLFATVAGVSKVGSYTGTAADLNVDCGFTTGARFVMIKRADSTGDWYVWDSARGIVAGNDPYVVMNNFAAEVTSTDYIDSQSVGFTVTSTAPAALNASGGTYIFLAIA